MINTIAKDDEGKIKPSLVPIEVIEAIARVREYGIKKYKEKDNWKLVEKERYVDALYRHLLKYVSGEQRDPESGLKHTEHMACNIAFILALEKTKKD